MIHIIPVSFNILREVKSLQVGLFFDENELQGRSADKSLESTTARVNNRRAYGLIGDVFDLAAAYAAAIAQGHCFRDANKRTAFQTMDVVLELNGINIDCSADEVGDNVIALAQSAITESDFAAWLRSI